MTDVVDGTRRETSKPRRRWHVATTRGVRLASVSTLAVVLLGIAPVEASSVDSVSPLSGPPGTIITVTGVCDNPGFDEDLFTQINSAAGVFGGDVAPTQSAPVDPVTFAGAAQITVPLSVVPGADVFVYAFCGGASGTQTIPECIGESQCAEFLVTEPDVPDEPVGPTPDEPGPSDAAEPITAVPRFTG